MLACNKAAAAAEALIDCSETYKISPSFFHEIYIFCSFFFININIPKIKNYNLFRVIV